MKQTALFSLFFMILGSTFLLQSQQKYTETIKIEAWTIPIFAVDGRGMPVLDLKPADIRIYVNGRQIRNFNFFKKSFVMEQGISPRRVPDNILIEREKTIILLFDTATSKATAIMRLKSIARDLVKNARTGGRFIVLNILPFKGLTYLGGPILKIQDVLKLIDKINPRRNFRDLTSAVNDSRSNNFGGSGRYGAWEASDFRTLNYGIIGGEKQKAASFARSFEDLYYAINSIKGIKFIYLFSEGISGIGVNPNHIMPMFKYLQKCGAFLFCINPNGASADTGEHLLKAMARVTGGKYVYGKHTDITTKIKNVHHSYYELAFVAPEGIDGRLINITVRSKDPGIKIHTMRTMERNKSYREMTETEQQVMVLNLITKNPLYNINLSTRDIKILQTIDKGNRLIFNNQITSEFMNKRVHLYKVQLRDSDNKTIIQKTVLIPKTDQLAVTFSRKEGFKEYYALVNPYKQSALLKGFSVPEIKIDKLGFQERKLQFYVLGYRMQNIKNINSGIIRVTIQAWDTDNNSIYNKSKSIILKKDRVQISIPFKNLWKGDYSIMVLAEDLLTGRQHKTVYPVVIN